MKKLSILCTLLLCVPLCCAACSKEEAIESAPAYDIVLDYEYTGVGQLAEEASLILLGTVQAETFSDDLHSFYTIAVEETLFGDAREEVKVSAMAGLLKLDTRFMLFLREADSVFYVEPMVLLVDIQSLIEVHADGSLTLPNQFTESYPSVEKLRDAIYALPPPETAASAKPVVDTLEPQELIGRSDVIFSGEITALSYISATAAGNATISISVLYKGEVEGDTVNCLVPQGLIAGEAYLFFRSDGVSSMPSRQNSVYRIGEKESEALIQLLKERN